MTDPGSHSASASGAEDDSARASGAESDSAGASDADAGNAVTDADVTDTLPEDLDLGALDHSDYVFPNNNRRRIPGALYVMLGLITGVGVSMLPVDGLHLNNPGLIAGCVVLTLFGMYHIVAGWNLNYDERDALLSGIRSVDFPVGHASAQMGWRGWLSRPTWRILMYSNEPQPLYRGLALVDGVDGSVLDVIVEANPEDWSAFGAVAKEQGSDWGSQQSPETDSQQGPETGSQQSPETDSQQSPEKGSQQGPETGSKENSSV